MYPISVLSSISESIVIYIIKSLSKCNSVNLWVKSILCMIKKLKSWSVVSRILLSSQVFCTNKCQIKKKRLRVLTIELSSGELVVSLCFLVLTSQKLGLESVVVGLDFKMKIRSQKVKAFTYHVFF